MSKFVISVVVCQQPAEFVWLDLSCLGEFVMPAAKRDDVLDHVRSADADWNDVMSFQATPATVFMQDTVQAYRISDARLTSYVAVDKPYKFRRWSEHGQGPITCRLDAGC